MIIRVAATLVVLAFSSMAIAQQPEISQGTYTTSHSKDECLSETETALDSAGFKSEQKKRGSRFEGENGDYKAQVNCSDSSATVVVTGPERRQAIAYRREIGDSLKE